MVLLDSNTTHDQGTSHFQTKVLASSISGNQGSTVMSDTQSKAPEGFDWRAFTPEDSPKTPMDVRADPRHKRLSTAEVEEGGDAHFFARPIYDFSSGKKIETGDTFDLRAVSAEKPVALIFGSYT